MAKKPMPPRYIAVPFLGPGPILTIGNPVLTATTISSSEIDLSIAYSGPPNAISYAFESATQVGGPFLPLSSSASPSFKNTGLTPNSQFFYRARVQAADGRFSNFSNIVSATTLQSAPSAPLNLNVTVASSSEIDLTWTAVSGATSYNIYQNGVLETTGVLTPSFSDTTLSPSTLYTYNVTAINQFGESPQSAPASGTTPSAGGGGAGIPTINWSPGHWFEIGGVDSLHSISDFTTNSQIMVNMDTTNIIVGFSAVFDLGQTEGAMNDYTAFFNNVQQMITFCQSVNRKLFLNFNLTGNVVHATVPSYMLNNSTYGRVGAGPGTATQGYQGGLFSGPSPINFNSTTNSSPNGSAKLVRFDNANVCARVANMLAQLYIKFGNQIYGVNPCYSEIEDLSNIVPELTSAAFTAALYGQGGLFDQIRAACPTWFLLTTPSFLGQSDYDTVFACTDRNNVSVGLYDFCNDAAVRTGGVFRTFPTVGAFLGGQYVNNVFQPVAGKIDRRALFGGRDFSAHIGDDELGARSSSGSTTGTVPPARIGDGALNTALWPMCQKMQTTHQWWYKNVSQGPLCNTLASYTGQPPNYTDYSGWGNLFGFIKQNPTSPVTAYPSTWPTH